MLGGSAAFLYETERTLDYFRLIVCQQFYDDAGCSGLMMFIIVCFCFFVGIEGQVSDDVTLRLGKLFFHELILYILLALLILDSEAVPHL